MKPRGWSILAASVALGSLAAALRAQPASTAETCRAGYVWREAFLGDLVCVTPQTRRQAARDNARADARKEPGGGAYGPDTCHPGYVWREARPEDHVCVTPQTRAQTASDNLNAAARRVPAEAPGAGASAGPPIQGTAGAARAGRAAEGAGTLGPAREETLPKENVRCRSYAQRAVDQHRLTTRDSKCRVRSDARWHDNSQEHYRWCLTAGGVLDSEEKARDAYLYRCGAQTRID